METKAEPKQVKTVEQQVEELTELVGNLLASLPGTPPSPEHEAVCFTDLWGQKNIEGRIHLVKIGLTIRNGDPLVAFEKLKDAVHTIEEKYKFHPYNPFDFRVAKPAAEEPGQPQAKAPQTPPLPPAPGQPVSPPPINPPPAATSTGTAPAGTPPSTTAPIGGSFQVNRVVNAPRADGLTSLEFWITGRKFADLKAVMKPERAAEIFSALDPAWVPEHFTKPAMWDMTFQVNWQNSTKLNSKGVPYRDVISVNY